MFCARDAPRVVDCLCHYKKITNLEKEQKAQKSIEKPVQIKSVKAKDMASQLFDDTKTAYAPHSTYKYTFHLKKRPLEDAHANPNNKKQVCLCPMICALAFLFFVFFRNKQM